MSRPLSKAARQRAHWDGVLAADNIGERPLTARALRRELHFAHTPDFKVLHRALLRHVNPLILDLGGGLGVHAIAVAAAGNRVVVADVSGERLRALSRVMERLNLWGRVLLVQTEAENLALRSGVVSVAWTKSVLIHTELDQALDELARCLGPTGEAILAEPTDANPLVNLCRRRCAPTQWAEITEYFTEERVRRVLDRLTEGRERRFYVIAFLAFAWQFALRSVPLFKLSLLILNPLDQLLMRISPAWRRRAWFVVMEGKGR